MCSVDGNKRNLPLVCVCLCMCSRYSDLKTLQKWCDIFLSCVCCSRYRELNSLQSGCVGRVIIAYEESENAQCLQERRVTMWALKYRITAIVIRRSQVLSCRHIRLYSWHTPSLRYRLYRCTVHITNWHTSVHTLHSVMSSAAELSLTGMTLFIAVFMCSLRFKFSRCQLYDANSEMCQ
jgi:hypothetical protein